MSFLLGQMFSISWAIPVISQIFVFIDSIIYMLAEYAYLIFETATVLNFSNSSEILGALLSRITSLVTVFMVFRIAIIFIQYLIEPEKVKNEKIGGSKLLINIVISISLLALVNTGFLFGLIRDFQTVIFSTKEEKFEVLDDFGLETSKNVNVLAQVFSGIKFSDVNYGRIIGVRLLNTFLHQRNGNEIKSWFNAYGPPCPKNWTSQRNEGIFCSIANEKNGTFMSLNQLNISDFLIFGDYSLMYYPIISAAVGIYLLITFVKFASQILIRAMKLFLLEMLAPIAIISYIDPEGKDIFNKFWKTYAKIFFDLFLRVGLVYLSIVLIEYVQEEVLTGSHFTSDGFTEMLLEIMFIFAVFKFAEIAPKLIADIFGFTFEEGKKGTFGKTLRGIVGTGIGLGVGLKSARAEGLGGAATAFQGLSGAFQGGRSGATSTGIKDFIAKQGQTNTGIRNRSGNIGDLGGMRGYVGSYTDQFTGKTKNLQRTIDDTTAYDSNIDSFMDSYKSQFANTENPVRPGSNYGTLESYIDNDSSVLAERLKEQHLQDQMTAGGNIDPTKLESARKDRILAENNAKKQYNSILNQKLAEALKNPNKFDANTRTAYEKMKRSNPEMVKVSQNQTGYYENNVKDMKDKNATARIKAQIKIRNRGSNTK